MKYLKEYYDYDNEVAEICKKFDIRNWSIRDGLVDVDGGVHLNNKGLYKIPIKFGRVGGNFYCADNNLTTLEGSPREVGGNFICNYNKLNTLEGGPKEVGGYFDCSWNELTTLEGSTKEVGSHFACHNNQITTLEGGPKEVGGNFDCYTNKLTTLEYMPNVKGNIVIDSNPLPKEIYQNKKLLKYIIKYQEEYDIWFDGNLDIPRFNSMIQDIKEFDINK
jgi:hypothetical protein